MSRERELLQKVVNHMWQGELVDEIKECLAQPEECVYQKLLIIEKENYVEMLPSELWLDGYEAGKSLALLSKQPEQTEQTEQEPTTRHALDSYWNQEAYQRGYAEAELKLKREPLTPQQISEGNQSTLNVTREAFKQGVKFAEKAHGITGVDDDN